MLGVSLVPIVTVAVPLWALELGATPATIGLAVGARAMLPVLLSIHGGVLIDRFGPRRVMLIAALVTLALAPLYPSLPAVAALIGLQLLHGMAQAMVWIAAQTEVGRLTRGDPGLIGRFAFVTQLGHFLMPVAAGAAWDAYGAWGVYGLAGTVSALAVAAVLSIPRASVSGPSGSGRRSLAPRLSDYLAAFATLGNPAVAFGIVTSILFVSSTAVRMSFFPVYLKGIAFSGAEIGILLGLGSLCGSFAGLTVGRLTRLLSAAPLMLLSLAVAAAFLAAVPLAADMAALAALIAVHGFANGLTFPLNLSVLTRAVRPEEQGRNVGLRTTTNRLANFVVPVAMGLIVEAAGLASGFYIMGAVALAGIAAAALFWLRVARRAIT